MLRFASIVAGFAVVACLPARAQTQAPQPIVGSNQGREANQHEVVLPIFAFHSGFWANLHHFLYEQARQLDNASLGASEQPAPAPSRPISSGRPEPQTGSAPLQPPTPALLPEEERQWKRAVGYYAARLAGQDLEFNGDMVLLNNRLAELEGCPEIDGSSSPGCASGLREGLVAALEEAAPIYRAHWWPRQDRANRAWVAVSGELIQRYGTAVSKALADTYRSRWPANPIRVDVVPYAGRWGAYASLSPVHIVIASTDPRNQGLAALAVVFDEASRVFAPGVAEALANEFHDQNKLVRRDLWQAMLFYTAAETVERILNVSGGVEETPAEARWVREGLRSRGWHAYAGLLERAWQPYLDREVDFPTAIHLLVGQL